jgi:hypothetical protein
VVVPGELGQPGAVEEPPQDQYRGKVAAHTPGDAGRVLRRAGSAASRPDTNSTVDSRAGSAAV